MPHVEDPFQVCEFFSGVATVSKSCQQAFIATASLDIKLGEKVPTHRRNPFDLSLPSGLAILGILNSGFEVVDLFFKVDLHIPNIY